jgi:hypothetical protein
VKIQPRDLVAGDEQALQAAQHIARLNGAAFYVVGNL